MIAARQSWQAASCSLRRAVGRRDLSSSARRAVVTKFTMPAMSPTMTEGGLATWKVKEGQSFAAGDVLLEIETDKATMDVEAQEEGIMAKIIVEAGAKAVPVGKTIAMLAEEGDDISNVEVPKDEEPAASSTGGGAKEQAKQETAAAGKPKPSKSDSAPSAQHVPDLGSRQFPSVSRLLLENSISAQEARSKIKGTGLHGMITKGDVLAYLGKASSPTGTFKPAKGGIAELGGPASVGQSTAAGAGKSVKAGEPLTGDAVRSLIMGGLAAGSHSARAKEAASKSTARIGSPSPLTAAGARQNVFDELLDDYSFVHRPITKGSSAGVTPAKDAFKGLL